MQCEIYHDRDNEPCPMLGTANFLIPPRAGEFISNQPEKSGKQWEDNAGFAGPVEVWRITEIIHDVDDDRICVFVVPRQPPVSMNDEKDKPW